MTRHAVLWVLDLHEPGQAMVSTGSAEVVEVVSETPCHKHQLVSGQYVGLYPYCTAALSYDDLEP